MRRICTKAVSAEYVTNGIILGFVGLAVFLVFLYGFVCNVTAILGIDREQDKEQDEEEDEGNEEEENEN